MWSERNIGKMEIDRYVSVVSIPTHKKNYSTQQQEQQKMREQNISRSNQ